jgi:hypothetical protein
MRFYKPRGVCWQFGPSLGSEGLCSDAVRSNSVNPGHGDSLTNVCCSSRGSRPQYARLLRYSSTAEYGIAVHTAVVRETLAGSINMQPATHSDSPLCWADCRSWTHVTVTHCQAARAAFSVIINLSTPRGACRVKWVPVITAWRVLRLRMEERPPVMEGSCEYIE